MVARSASHRIGLACFIIQALSFGSAYAGLKPANYLQFFVPPDQPATLRWAFEGGDQPGRLAYEITDYWDRRVVAAEADLVDADKLEISLRLGKGFYEIHFPFTRQRFGICVAAEPPKAVDPFFCMDSAISWLEKRDELREVLPQMLKRMGVCISRERARWRSIQPAADRWEWQTGDRYEALRQSYAKAGVGLLEMAHDAPEWMGPTQSNPYPANLPAVARSWMEIQRRWHPYWTALEIWNEPDIQFGGMLPADQYVQVAKAVSYGLHDAKPATRLVGGVFTDICPDAYRRLSAQNGLLDYVDTVSFHTYTRADRVESMAEMYRVWLKKFGKESMPLWITESGRPWKKGAERPVLQEDADSAADIVMKAIEARACGIESYFAFVYVYYEENDWNFGMLGKEATPLRSLVAYAQAIAALSGRAYRGDLSVTGSRVQRARVFGEGAETVVVLYTGKVDATARVKLEIARTRLEGIDGRKLEVPADGAIPIPDGLTYVWVDAARLGDRLRTDVPAARLFRLSRQAPPVRPKPAPVILQHVFDERRMKASPSGYTVSSEQAGAFALHVKVNNLSKLAQRVVLTLTHAGDAPGGERTVEVPAESVSDVTFDLDLRPWLQGKAACTLVVTGKCEGMEPISALAVDVGLASPPPDTAPGS